jgi:hypothetical protein
MTLHAMLCCIAWPEALHEVLFVCDACVCMYLRFCFVVVLGLGYGCGWDGWMGIETCGAEAAVICTEGRCGRGGGVMEG